MLAVHMNCEGCEYGVVEGLAAAGRLAMFSSLTIGTHLLPQWDGLCVLPCVVVCCIVLQYVASYRCFIPSHLTHICCRSGMVCACCSVLLFVRVAACCCLCVLQCIAVCCMKLVRIDLSLSISLNQTHPLSSMLSRSLSLSLYLSLWTSKHKHRHKHTHTYTHIHTHTCTHTHTHAHRGRVRRNHDSFSLLSHAAAPLSYTHQEVGECSAVSVL